MSAGPRSDLEERTFRFAKDVRDFVKRLPRTISNAEDVKQVVRSSGSIGANYLEAQEALSKKDFRMRVRIARKEAKETRYWLRLLSPGNDADVSHQRDRPLKEAFKLICILSAIVNKATLILSSLNLVTCLILDT